MEASVYRVIIAEDEELMLNNLVQKVTRAGLGFKVIATAQTGTQALQLVKEQIPDLLITDIKMPVMDGIELLSQVSQRFPFLRTVIISGFSEFEYAQKAIRFHVDNYLLKPVDEEELREALLKIKTKLDLESEKYRDVFQDTSASPRQIAETLHEYIIRNYDKEINLNSIAHNLNYSSSYLTKIFHQHYQTTPGKYIISIRIQNASQLLLHHPELTIGQIGDMVGYPEQGYFSRIFKKQTGLSPFEYRENKGRLPEAPL